MKTLNCCLVLFLYSNLMWPATENTHFALYTTYKQCTCHWHAETRYDLCWNRCCAGWALLKLQSDEITSIFHNNTMDLHVVIYMLGEVMGSWDSYTPYWWLWCGHDIVNQWNFPITVHVKGKFDLYCTSINIYLHKFPSSKFLRFLFSFMLTIAIKQCEMIQLFNDEIFLCFVFVAEQLQCKFPDLH